LFGQGQGLLLKAKAKDLTLKAKDKDLTFNAKDSKFVLEDISRPRTKDNNTGHQYLNTVYRASRRAATTHE